MQGGATVPVVRAQATLFRGLFFHLERGSNGAPEGTDGSKCGGNGERQEVSNVTSPLWWEDDNCYPHTTVVAD